MARNLKHGECGAKTRRGTACKQPAKINGRCRYHGGLTPKGVMSPHYKHGRYSKYMPKGMLEEYERGLHDPELLVLVDQVALIDSRVTGLLQRLSTRESGRAWKELQRLWKDFDLAMRKGDAEDIQYLRVEIDRIIRQGVGEVAQWEELGVQVDRLSRLKKSERDRRVAAKQVVKADAVLLAMITLIETVTGSVRKYTDVQTARNILAEISQAYELIAGQRTTD